MIQKMQSKWKFILSIEYLQSWAPVWFPFTRTLSLPMQFTLIENSFPNEIRRKNVCANVCDIDCASCTPDSVRLFSYFSFKKINSKFLYFASIINCLLERKIAICKFPLFSLLCECVYFVQNIYIFLARIRVWIRMIILGISIQLSIILINFLGLDS